MFGITPLPAVLLTLVVSQPLIGQQTHNDSFQLTRLGLEMRVDYDRQAIDGTATLHHRNAGTRAASEVSLLLNRLMTVSSIADLAGAPIRFDQDVVLFQDDSLLQVDAALVKLGRPLAPGDSVTIVVRYGGRLAGYTETGSLYIRDHVERDFTIIRTDAFAFPSLGSPSRTALRSMAREPFAFSAEVTVPTGLVVAMGGRAAGTRTHDSTTTWAYRSEGPVPFLNITIAPYRTIEGKGVRIFYFPQDSAGAQMVQRAVHDALARYTTWYGALGQDLQLPVIEIPEGWGSQASATAGIIETADAFRDRAQLHQLYHELSHLWNVDELDRPSPRWNEGLASFLEWRMAAELDGWSGWNERLGRLEESLRKRCASRTPCATVPFADYGKERLTDTSYPVGALMFYLLFQALGPDRFDRVYRDFYAQHRERGALSSELATAFANASPAAKRILADWFFTTRWYTRLAAGQSVPQMLAEYARN